MHWTRGNILKTTQFGGSIPISTERCALELCGIPLQSRTQRFLKFLLNPVGCLLKIISDGVGGGNPNGVRVEIEKRVGRPIPTTLPAQVGGLESQVCVLHLVQAWEQLTKLSSVATRLPNEVHYMECLWSPRRQSERYCRTIFT